MNKGIQGPIRRKQDMSIALQMGVPRAWVLANPSGVIYRSWGIRSVVASSAGVCIVNLPFRLGSSSIISATPPPTMIVGAVTTAGAVNVDYLTQTSVRVIRYNPSWGGSNSDFFLVIYGT